MNRIVRTTRSTLRRHALKATTYTGSDGTAWFAGSELRAPSIASYFCGDDVKAGGGGFVRPAGVPGQIAKVASTGGLAILSQRALDSRFDEILGGAVAVPGLVDLHTDLPSDIDQLRSQLLTSTTREDFRRIRKANFTYRVTVDPDEVRQFHARHVEPLVKHRFPEDGRVWSLDAMLAALDEGGELVCADIEGEWVAGIFNIAGDTTYALRSLGIRDADNDIRQKRVIAALIVRSLERAVELGCVRATLGRSLPFLGKGPVWFKAKWGGMITIEPEAAHMHMFADLTSPAVRRMLTDSPIIHSEDNGELAASTWLEPGEKPLQVTVREAGRFQGITRWYVVADSETLAAGVTELSENQKIVPVPFDASGDGPIWLGTLVSSAATPG